MKAEEFKAWFDGYTDGIGGKPPTKEQWAKIKKRVSDIDGQTVTREYFYRYWPYHSYQTYFPYSTTCNTTCGSHHLAGNNFGDVQTSTTAMYALGQAEGTAS